MHTILNYFTTTTITLSVFRRSTFLRSHASWYWNFLTSACTSFTFKKAHRVNITDTGFIQMILSYKYLLLEHVHNACRVSCLLLSASFQFLLLFRVQWFLWARDCLNNNRSAEKLHLLYRFHKRVFVTLLTSVGQFFHFLDEHIQLILKLLKLLA